MHGEGCDHKEANNFEESSTKVHHCVVLHNPDRHRRGIHANRPVNLHTRFTTQAKNQISRKKSIARSFKWSFSPGAINH